MENLKNHGFSNFYDFHTNLVHHFQRHEESPCLPNRFVDIAPDISGLAVYRPKTIQTFVVYETVY